MQPLDRQKKRARARTLLDGLGKAGETSEELRELLELLFDLEVAAMDPSETPTPSSFTPSPFQLGNPPGHENGVKVR